jgi:hypothetical protein
MVTLCPECRRGTVDTSGDVLPLTASEVDGLCCDARILPSAQTEPIIAGAATAATPRGGPPNEPPVESPLGPASASHGGAPAPPTASHVGPTAVVAAITRRAGLMVSTEMPETLRRSVLRRHNGRCAVPGCSNGAHLHIHHCDLRSEGGGHDPERLVPLCDVHHRSVHDGRLVVDGTWSNGFRFLHADGTPYGTRALPDPARTEAATIAFSALCKSGYKQSEARQAVDSIRDRITPDMPVAEVVRLAFVASAGLPSQRHVFQAREALADYVRLRAA